MPIKLNYNYQAVNLIISHEDMYSFYKNNVISTKERYLKMIVENS